MLYRVKARPDLQEIGRFREQLSDGTIESQRPDGSEIVASMKRAVIAGDRAEWYETCYCNPPLRHEKATVYDKYFTDMQVEPANKEQRLSGESFWQFLQECTTKSSPNKA